MQVRVIFWLLCYDLAVIDACGYCAEAEVSLLLINGVTNLLSSVWWCVVSYLFLLVLELPLCVRRFSSRL